MTEKQIQYLVENCVEVHAPYPPKKLPVRFRIFQATVLPGETTIVGPITDDEIHPGILEVLNGDKDPVKLDSEDLGLPPGWPRKLWVLAYATGHHGCMSFNGVYGLAVFKKRENCLKYAKCVINPPSRSWLPKQLTFEEARQLAKQKADAPVPPPAKKITAMILADVGPLILFVG